MKNDVANWDDAHRYSPAPRHRRRKILKTLDRLQFSDCLDAGCAQPYLLDEIRQRYKVASYGCDISAEVITKNRRDFPYCEFKQLDLVKDNWSKQFDLVVSSEVLEHIPNWQAALSNIMQMTNKYLLLTVPSGKIGPIDKRVGHLQHFSGEELKQEILHQGFKINYFFKYGFPIHSLYKKLINQGPSEQIYSAFSGGKKYSLAKKLFSHALYGLFFINDFFRGGTQIFLLAERSDLHVL